MLIWALLRKDDILMLTSQIMATLQQEMEKIRPRIVFLVYKFTMSKTCQSETDTHHTIFEKTVRTQPNSSYSWKMQRIAKGEI